MCLHNDAETFSILRYTKYEIWYKNRKKKAACDQTPAEFQAMRKLKAYETIQEPNQLIKVTRLPADAFMFIGNICINKTKQMRLNISNIRS